jgi:hypothetical protein
MLAFREQVVTCLRPDRAAARQRLRRGRRNGCGPRSAGSFGAADGTPSGSGSPCQDAAAGARRGSSSSPTGSSAPASGPGKSRSSRTAGRGTSRSGSLGRRRSRSRRSGCRRRIQRMRSQLLRRLPRPLRLRLRLRRRQWRRPGVHRLRNGGGRRPLRPRRGQRRKRLRVGLLLWAICAPLLLSGCGSETDPTTSTRQAASKPQKPSSKKEFRGFEGERVAEETVAPSHCAAGHPACRVAIGRIVYVERVDADGDGDAHFVIRDPHGITLAGLTAIDVRAGLRPHPLPGPGDLISAAGPVQTGSYGQDQIHALELHVAE